jgi:hypothetical protein
MKMAIDFCRTDIEARPEVNEVPPRPGWGRVTSTRRASISDANPNERGLSFGLDWPAVDAWRDPRLWLCYTSEDKQVGECK